MTRSAPLPRTASRDGELGGQGDVDHVRKVRIGPLSHDQATGYVTLYVSRATERGGPEHGQHIGATRVPKATYDFDIYEGKVWVQQQKAD